MPQFHPSVAFQEIIAEWNCALLALLRTQAQERRFDLPAVAENDLVKSASFLLEEMTNRKRTFSSVIVLVAPTGVGKSTIGKCLERAGYVREPRVITRRMRPGEKQGYDYHFVSEEEFDGMEKKGDFFHVSIPGVELVKSKKAEGHRAALRKDTVERMRNGRKSYLEGGPSTAKEVVQLLRGEGIPAELVILLPPSAEEWICRLEGRVHAERLIDVGATLTSEQVEGRLRRGIDLLNEGGSIADRFIVNDTVERLEQLFQRVA